MNKIDQELAKAITQSRKDIPVIADCYSILEKHCVGFAKWRMGTMYDKEKGIDGKAIIRQNPDDYWEQLFNLYIKSL